MPKRKRKGLSLEDKEVLERLKAELGERATFFDSPIGLIALAPPEQASELYWKMREEVENEALEDTAVMAKFALNFVVYPEQDKVRETLRRHPAFSLRLSSGAQKLLGHGIEEDPDLSDNKEELKQLEELQKTHGDAMSWYMVPSVGLVVLAPPKNPSCYRQFFAAVRKDDSDDEETYSTFALDCVVHPKRETVRAALKEYPVLARTFALRGDGLCGGDFQELGNV